MANTPSFSWGIVVVLAIAFAAGVYFGFRRDGGGEEYGDLAFLSAA